MIQDDSLEVPQYGNLNRLLVKIPASETKIGPWQTASKYHESNQIQKIIRNKHRHKPNNFELKHNSKNSSTLIPERSQQSLQSNLQQSIFKYKTPTLLRCELNKSFCIVEQDKKNIGQPNPKKKQLKELQDRQSPLKFYSPHKPMGSKLICQMNWNYVPMKKNNKYSFPTIESKSIHLRSKTQTDEHEAIERYKKWKLMNKGNRNRYRDRVDFSHIGICKKV